MSALAPAWDDLMRRHGIAGAAADAVLAELVAAYAEPHRHYHTLDHIAALLRLLDEHGAGATGRDAIRLAILFHDAIYDPARQDNEAASAAMAQRRLSDLGFPQPVIVKVERLILATRHGIETPAGDADLDLLVDLDLAVLAAPEAEYRAYADAIRREYAIYPDAVYRPGRRRVLESFLARDRIYRSERLRALWEASARANLAREIAELS